MFNNSKAMREYVKDILTKKNIGKLPRTLASHMDDFASAEFFNNAEKMKKYAKSIKDFCEKLKARDINDLPESVKSDTLALEILQNRAITHFRKVRELSELRKRLLEKEEEVNLSLGKIPLVQREEFSKLLVDLQNLVAQE